MKLFWTFFFCVPLICSAAAANTLEFEDAIQEIINRIEDGQTDDKQTVSDNRLNTQNDKELAPVLKVPPLTLEQCLNIMLRDNLSLKAQQKQVENKKLLKSATFLDMLPSLSVSSSRTDIINAPSSGSEAESYSTSLTISQPIYHGKSLYNSWKLSKISHNQALLEEDRKIQSLIFKVKEAWYDLLKADHLEKEAKSALDRLHLHAQNAKAFYDEGTYWANDLLQAQVEVAKGEQTLIEAQNDLFLAKANLNRYMQRPITAPLHFEGALKRRPIGWKLKSAFTYAMEHRTDLRKSRLSLLSSNLMAETKSADMLPKVDLTGTTQWSGSDMSYEGARPTSTIAVTLQWSAFEWGKTRKEIEAATVSTEKSYLELRDLESSIQLEVRKAFLEAEEYSQKVDLLDKTLDQAKENYRVNQIRYKEQLGTATDVLDAMDLLTSTRSSAISAISSYLKSLASLDLAVGKK